MLITKEVTINLSYRHSSAVVDVLQGDSGRALAVHFRNGEEAWQIPADADILMQYQCQDGTGGVFDSRMDGTPAYSVNGDTLTICLIPQICAVAGCTRMQITIMSGGSQITTFPVEIRVAEQVNTEVANGEYINLLQWWLSRDAKGETGDPGVYLGAEAPEDPAVRVWIYPQGTAENILRIRGEDGGWRDIPAIVGPKGDPDTETAQKLKAHADTTDMHVTAEEKARWNAHLQATADNVIEEGYCDGWYYRRWSHGRAECFYRGSFTTGATMNMSGVYYTPTLSVPIPQTETFTFKEIPTILVSGGSTACVNWAREFASRMTEAKFIVIANEKQSNIQVDVNIAVYGKWQ